MTPQSAGIARVDRAFDESPDRYSCAFLLRLALQDVRDLVFSNVGRPSSTEPYPAIGAVRTYSLVVDRVLDRAYRFVARYVGSGEELGDLPLALIATGSHGRRELCPYSSVDLLVVHRGPQLAARAVATIEAMLPFLSDAGFPVTHRVRSFGEVRAAMKSDFPGATLAMDGRFLGGDAGLFLELERDICRPYLERHGADEFTRRVAHARHRVEPLGSVSSQKEPDVMDSAGGLRDVHASLWIDRAARVVYDLRERPLFPWDASKGAGSLQEVLEAYDFLLSVRADAHLDTGSKSDRLDLATWERVVARRGRTPGGAPVTVSALKRKYHRHSLVIGAVLDRLLDEVATLRDGDAAAAAPSDEECAIGCPEVLGLGDMRKRSRRDTR